MRQDTEEMNMSRRRKVTTTERLTLGPGFGLGTGMFAAMPHNIARSRGTSVVSRYLLETEICDATSDPHSGDQVSRE
jgi:ABC-type uncharacterized transport system YnjBCD substrate-binding protein